MKSDLTLIERRQIAAIRKHMSTVDYGSFSGDAIAKLLAIIRRITGEDEVSQASLDRLDQALDTACKAYGLERTPK